jgi:hypothetical protein
MVNHREALAGDPDELTIRGAPTREPGIRLFSRSERVGDLDSFQRRGRDFAKKFAKLLELMKVIPDEEQRGRTDPERLVFGRSLGVVLAHAFHGPENGIDVEVLVVWH